MPALPSMASDPDQMLGSQGMSAPAPQRENGSSPINAQDQARGGVQTLGQLQKSVKEQLEAIATQFPTVAKDTKAVQQSIEQGIQRLVKAIVQTVQTPEPDAPTALR